MEPNKPQKRPDKEKDIEELIEDLKEKIESQTGKTNFEIVRIKATPITLKSRILSFLTSLLINFLVLTSLSGYIHWVEVQTIFHFVIFILLFSILEEIIKLAILRFVPSKIITISFGSIIWLSTVISFVITTIYIPGFTLIDSNATVVLFFTFMIIRAFLNNVLTKYRITKKIVKARKDKKDKGE